MSAASPSSDKPKISLPIHAIQPGGGWGMSLELGWGKFRRWVLRTFSSGYVKQQVSLRRGNCETCPGKARGCTGEVIDTRDLKYFRNVCGYHFDKPDDFPHRDKIPFARYGLAELITITLVSVVLSGLIGWLLYLGIPYWIVSILGLAIFLVWLETAWFFRSPQRAVATDPNLIISPCDGTVVDVGEVEAPDFPGGKALRLGVFLSIFNVHVNRIPRTGTVTKLQYFEGGFLSALKPESIRENEQLWIDIEDAANKDIIRIKQIAGAIARRIVCDLKVGQKVTAGEVFGMIKLGSRAELFLPTHWKVELMTGVGQKILGGSTVLGKLLDR